MPNEAYGRLSNVMNKSALRSKTAALSREFDELREKTAGISWCDKCWWEDETLHYSDWILLDAWYRSRLAYSIPNC
jgi:hypothetical protein